MKKILILGTVLFFGIRLFKKKETSWSITYTLKEKKTDCIRTIDYKVSFNTNEVYVEYFNCKGVLIESFILTAENRKKIVFDNGSIIFEVFRDVNPSSPKFGKYYFAINGKCIKYISEQ